MYACTSMRIYICVCVAIVFLRIPLVCTVITCGTWGVAISRAIHLWVEWRGRGKSTHVPREWFIFFILCFLFLALAKNSTARSAGKPQLVKRIAFVMKTNIYGYHPDPEPFLRITTFVPGNVTPLRGDLFFASFSFLYAMFCSMVTACPTRPVLPYDFFSRHQ